MELDRQVTEFEGENEALQEKNSRQEGEIRELVARLDSAQVCGSK